MCRIAWRAFILIQSEALPHRQAYTGTFAYNFDGRARNEEIWKATHPNSNISCEHSRTASTRCFWIDSSPDAHHALVRLARSDCYVRMNFVQLDWENRKRGINGMAIISTWYFCSKRHWISKSVERTKTYPVRMKFDQYSITDSDNDISDFV